MLAAVATAIIGLTAAASRGETVLQVTQISYDYLDHPVCSAVRMNKTIYASLPSDPCSLGTQGSDGPDRITKNTYDAAGQLTEVDQAYGTSVQRAYARYSYNANGTKATEMDANGNKTLYAYDGFDRLSQIQYPLTTVGSGNPNSNDYETFGYDNNGNKTAWRRRNGIVFSYCYDALNQVTRTDPTGASCTSTASASAVFSGYDGLGHVVYLRYGSTTGAGITNTYDGLGELTATQDMYGRWVQYQYNQAGARTQLVYPDSHAIGSTLDTANRMIWMGMDSYTGLVGQAFNSLGQRTWLGRGGSVGGNYGYDNLGRLTSMTNDLVVGSANDITWTFAYNPAGQLTSTTASSTNYDYKETANATTNQTYDGLNRDAAIAAVSGGYDANANLTNDGSRLFYYDAYNRLTGVGSAQYPQNGPYLTFTYDPMGRLASQTYYTTTTAFLYDGTNLIAEYNGTGSTASMTERYVHGTGTDEPIAWYHGSGNTSTPWFFFQDYHGSVIGYADASGNLQASYEYGPYGEPEDSLHGNAFTNQTLSRFAYTGQAVLREASLYNYKARVYDPIMGHFLQTDPIGSKDDLDLYAYTGDDPTDKTDPTGLCPVDCKYKTKDAAGAQAVRDVNGASIKQDREYGGTVYRNKDGSYSYTAPNQGTRDTVDTGSAPAGTRQVGDYHTHGGNDAGYINDEFSNQDKRGNDHDHDTGYLGTPSKDIKKYTPGQGVVTIGHTDDRRGNDNGGHGDSRHNDDHRRDDDHRNDDSRNRRHDND